ncbi:MAG TPA: ABC transporter ATP-binding protein [Paracoccaceae bacterium]|nr:ABC transporter ATP-binding protein [Paracoccaceae bacterium]
MTAVLEVRGLVRRFGGLLATDDVSLTLMPGEVHALIGPNGAGKTTLINQISGELAPDAGAVLIDGQDVTRSTVPQRVALGLGRTFQITSLLPEMTVRQNIALAAQAREGGSFRIFDALARRASLWDTADGLLRGTPLGPRAHVAVTDLSHGERKQLELLVALARAPRFLLLDEPMAGLGHVESQEMIATLRGIARSTPMLLVEHDMEAVFALASRISVLVYGRIIATGDADAIRTDPAVREAYLGEEEA